MTDQVSGGLLRRHRDFRLLWCSEVTGKFGAAVTAVSMPLVAISTMNVGTFEIGLLSAAVWIPWLAIGLPAGAWVDRMRRRPVMLVSAAVSLVLFISVPLAHWAGVLSLGWLLAVSLLGGVAAVFFQTAYTVYLPSIVERDDLPEGNSKLHGSAAAAQIAGVGGGGLIAQLSGAVNGMYANAGTFVISAACLLGIRHREEPVVREKTRDRALLTEVGEGLRLVSGDPWLRALTLFGTASNLALMGYQSILIVFLVRNVGLGEGALGGIIAIANSGGVAGAFIARRASARIGTARAMLLFAVGLTALDLLIPLTFGGPGLLLYAVGGFSVSAGVVAVNVLKAGFHQRYCPPALLGRLTATSSFLNFGALPLGALLGGVIGSLVGVHPAMWILTAGVPLAGLILVFSPIRGCRDLPVTPRPDATVADTTESTRTAAG